MGNQFPSLMGCVSSLHLFAAKTFGTFISLSNCEKKSTDYHSTQNISRLLEKGYDLYQEARARAHTHTHTHTKEYMCNNSSQFVIWKPNSADVYWTQSHKKELL
jgi:aspartyl aminopeptidase